MSSTDEPKEDEVAAVTLKARERDLLAIIATKDKRIQLLEEKLEAQSAFIGSIVTMSDSYRSTTRRKTRRVSWCATVDEPPARTSPSSDYGEIDVDSLVLDDDDLSILSDDGDNKDVDVDELARSRAEQETRTAPPSDPESEVKKKKPMRKSEKLMIQRIIERIRDDGDSVSV